MFLTLLRKECMQYLKSIIYYVFVAYLVFDFVIQLGSFEVVAKPEPGESDYSQYGTVETEDTALIMQAGLDQLLFEYDQGTYPTYPLGFYKKFTPNEEEQNQISEVILDMTGLTAQELARAYEDYKAQVVEFIEQMEGSAEGIVIEGGIPEMTIPVRADYSYETFLSKMEWLDGLLGGGSSFSLQNIKDSASQSATYEQACEIYNDFIREDKVTGAYARLFCDYEGITLALITVFLAVTRALRDRRAQADQVIYARRISSAGLVCSRYLAGVIMAVVPVFFISCITMVQAVYYARHLGVPCDYFAFARYIGVWLLPTILVTLALGFFLTEFTDSAIAILVQVVWWFVSIFSSDGLVIYTKFNLIPRFNSLTEYHIHKQMQSTLLWNRCFYTVMAAVVLLLTILVYDLKRKGVFVSVGAKLRNCKDKLAA